MPGIRISLITRSICSWANTSRPRSPLSAVNTRYPSGKKILCRAFRIFVSSSTNNNVLFNSIHSHPPCFLSIPGRRIRSFNSGDSLNRSDSRVHNIGERGKITIGRRNIDRNHSFRHPRSQFAAFDINACFISNFAVIHIQLKITDVQAIVNSRQQFRYHRSLRLRDADWNDTVKYKNFVFFVDTSKAIISGIFSLKTKTNGGFTGNFFITPIVFLQKSRHRVHDSSHRQFLLRLYSKLYHGIILSFRLPACNAPLPTTSYHNQSHAGLPAFFCPIIDYNSKVDILWERGRKIRP